MYRTLGVEDPDDSKTPIITWNDGYRNEYPRWAPDHEQNQTFKNTVVYVSDRNGNNSTGLNSNLFLINTNGTGFDANAVQAMPTAQPTTKTPWATSTDVPTTSVQAASEPFTKSIRHIMPSTTCDAPDAPVNVCRLYEQVPRTAEPSQEATLLNQPDESLKASLETMTNLIIDNGFEIGSSQWEYFLSATQARTSSDRNGNYVGALGSGLDSLIQQEVTIPNDTSGIIIDYYFRIGDGDGFDELYVGLADSYTDDIYFISDPISSWSSDTGWTEHFITLSSSLVYQLRGESVNLFFMVSQDDLAPDALFIIDDVFLLADNGSTLTPSPTRTPTHGTGDTPTPTPPPSNTGNEPRQLTFSEVDPSTTPSDPYYDTQLLPNPLFENNGVTVGDDVLFQNADFNGSFLMFRYYVTSEAAGKYDKILQYNNIGIMDFTGSEPIFRVFVLNDPYDSSLLDSYDRPYNYLYVNYPAWRGSEQEFAFLYTRVGNPQAMLDINGESVDPRPAPPAGVCENETETYDIGHLTFDTNLRTYDMKTPIWAFAAPEYGEGVYYRPSWQPGDSGSLTASYSGDGGSTYDVGIFLDGTTDNYADHVGFKVTTNGYSVMPSWGEVIAEEVPTSMYINSANRSGTEQSFMIDVSGFIPNEQVQLYQSFDGWQQTALAAETLVATQPANDEGQASFDVTIDSATIPAGTQTIWFKAVVLTSSKETTPGSISLQMTSTPTGIPANTPTQTPTNTPTPNGNYDIYLPLVTR